MSKYLAYSFLYDDASDLRCDFELLSDEISSMIGVLHSMLDERDRAARPSLPEELSRINELMYHINPSLRTKVAVTAEELEWLYEKTLELQHEVFGEPSKDGKRSQRPMTFFVPQGCPQAAYSHVVRCKCKTLVRLLSRHRQQGNEVPALLLDFVNLYAGYFYFLALWFNKMHAIKELPFTSRVY